MAGLLTTLNRIATALERIAAHAEMLTAETPAPTTEEPTLCLHPEDQRMALGGTTGWICQACEYQQGPT